MSVCVTPVLGLEHLAEIRESIVRRRPSRDSENRLSGAGEMARATEVKWHSSTA
jgi:hypothetical protein